MNISAKTLDLCNLFNAINVLVDEATFHLAKDGLAFRGIDPSHIAMIDVLIPPTDFSKYEVTDGVKFALRTDEVAKILKRFDRDEELNLTLDGEHLVISNQAKTFKTRTLEAAGRNTPIPKLDLKVKVPLTMENARKVLDDMHVVSEFVTISCDASDLTFSGKGDGGEAEVSFSSVECSCKEDSEATYSLDYIIKMVKAVSVDMVTLEYSSKMPLKLTLGRIAYFLAPRVQE